MCTKSNRQCKFSYETHLQNAMEIKQSLWVWTLMEKSPVKILNAILTCIRSIKMNFSMSSFDRFKLPTLPDSFQEKKSLVKHIKIS